MRDPSFWLVLVFVTLFSEANGNLVEASYNDELVSARNYSLRPAWRDGALNATPNTPGVHTFTVLITLDDGKAFDIRTSPVLITGI